MTKKKILFVYRTPRKRILNDWLAKKGPDSLLFGLNYFKSLGYEADFFDDAYSTLNIFHPIIYPLENTIIGQLGMGFKLDRALYFFPKFRNYDVIIATGDSVGLPFLALKYFGLIKKPIVFMSAGLAGALRTKTNTWIGKFYKKILPMADIFTSYSQIEIIFFEKEMGIKKGKIKYIPLCTDYNYFSKSSNAEKDIISAVGTEAGRDYKTLFEAVKNLPIRVEVACHPDNVKGIKVPTNVRIHLNIPLDRVRQLYQKSLLTVIPLYEKYRSSGQMVLLEAASARLPIVASSIKGLTSAFDFKDKQHLLYFNPQNPRDLREKINFLLSKPQKRIELGFSASELVKSNYTTKHLAQNLANLIQNL